MCPALDLKIYMHTTLQTCLLGALGMFSHARDFNSFDFPHRLWCIAGKPHSLVGTQMGWEEDSAPTRHFQVTWRRKLQVLLTIIGATGALCGTGRARSGICGVVDAVAWSGMGNWWSRKVPAQVLQRSRDYHLWRWFLKDLVKILWRSCEDLVKISCFTEQFPQCDFSVWLCCLLTTLSTEQIALWIVLPPLRLLTYGSETLCPSSDVYTQRTSFAIWTTGQLKVNLSRL